MPFDASGNFTRNQNFQLDRDNGVKILASHVDDEFDNMAAGMNLVFFRDGRVPMSADLRMNINGITGLKDGTLGSPAIKFNTEATTGAYLDGVGRYAIGVQSVRRGVFTTTGFDVTGNATVSGTLAVTGAVTQGGVAMAPLVSPTFTGVPAAPTPATADNSTKIATTAYVQAQGYALNSALAAYAPTASPTFSGVVKLGSYGDRISFTDALGSHPQFITSGSNALIFYSTDAAGSARAVWTMPCRDSTAGLTVNVPLIAASGLTVTGNVAASGTITQGGVAVAPLVSPTFTGTPAAPTPTAGDATTNIATTAFVDKLRGLPSRSVTTATLAATDRGNLVKATGAVTVPSGVFAADDVVVVYNNSAAGIALAQGTGLTLRLMGTTTTGSLTLAQRGSVTLLFISATECVASGAVS